ncbi:hypothetical protein M378DRAFT_200530 [Amanita muscaria Koide BX008]|uniref:Uncharacterized protein n=1 Tax=Amanita muscaria (strain Koide BX008) TaxID=946122 RepID=A0A0C2S6K8_AMAMK|nr:hypothetical protein M378DRAFT_200530 [Amanita muscaria Koide BX008]
MSNSSTPMSRYPRRVRLGGFVMSAESAVAWGSNISGKELHLPRNNPTVCKVILDKVRSYNVNFRDVGEVAGIDYMVITQSAWFQGYKDMDPELIPQFEEGEREAIARQLLEAEGVHNYQFKTVLG